METLNSKDDANKFIIEEAVRKEKRKRRLNNYDKMLFVFLIVAIIVTIVIYLYYYKGIGRGFVRDDWPKIADGIGRFFNGVGNIIERGNERLKESN